MDQKIIKLIAQQVGIPEMQVVHTIELLNEGATVPFISRYRKERTGSLDRAAPRPADGSWPPSWYR
jgi:uncharacterized protein